MQAVAVAGAAGAASGLMAYAVRGRSSALLAPSVYRGPASRRAIALTFDDGPSEATPELLEILDRHKVPATFFVCGRNAERLPEVSRAVAAAGHEIGNHSYSHPLFCFRSPRFIAGELAVAQQIIAAVTGCIPALFRAPFGVRWFGMREAQRRFNLRGVMWTILGRDWTLSAGAIVRRVLGKVSNGAIVCLHDGRELRERPDIGQTLRAVRQLIPALKDRGYILETVSHLICPTN